MDTCVYEPSIFRSKQRDPDPKDDSFVRKEPSACKGFHYTSAASFSHKEAFVRVRAPLFATERNYSPQKGDPKRRIRPTNHLTVTYCYHYIYVYALLLSLLSICTYVCMYIYIYIYICIHIHIYIYIYIERERERERERDFEVTYKWPFVRIPLFGPPSGGRCKMYTTEIYTPPPINVCSVWQK